MDFKDKLKEAIAASILFIVFTLIGMGTALARNDASYQTGKEIALRYYTVLDRPASGAARGRMILHGGAANDCGTATHGTTITVCVSDGTNWIPV